MRHLVVFVHNRANFGSLICHIPLLTSLRRHYGGARLTIVAPFAAAAMLVGDGLADAALAWPAGAWARLRTLRGWAPDLALSLRPTSMFIDLAIGLSGAPLRVGFASALSRRLFRVALPRDRTIYRALDYLRLVAPLGVRPQLAAHLQEMARRATAVIDPSQEWVCLMPGGTAPFKHWGIANFLALAARLRRDRPATRFVVVLGPQERGLADAVAASPLRDASLVLDSPDLGTLAHVASASRLVVANDCGPSHVAQLLGRPYVGLFSDQHGTAARVRAQWFLPRPHARWLAGPAGAPIAELPVERVYATVRDVLDGEA